MRSGPLFIGFPLQFYETAVITYKSLRTFATAKPGGKTVIGKGAGRPNPSPPIAPGLTINEKEKETDITLK